MKVIICHPAQQHSYRLATAAKRAGVLDRYITTVYYKKGSRTERISRILKGKLKKKAENRRCEELTDEDVVQFCEAEGLLKLFLLHFRRSGVFYDLVKYHLADRVARKTAKYAMRENADVVITYDDTSPLLFEILREKAPQIRRVMDVSAANTLYMREIYDRDLALAPAFADRLRRERKIVWDERRIERTRRELRAAQRFLVPSGFVARSLAFSGIREDRMMLCPYGANAQQFAAKEYRAADDGAIRFVYVGGVKELKGIFYLLEAFMKIPEDKAELIVVGNYDPDAEDTAPYLSRVTFTGSVLHDEMPAILQGADVFVFPSLGEGMSLSVLEAAMCGLPLIVSENSGIADWMTDGKEGYIIPIQSTEAIVGAVQRFLDDPSMIREMGKAAREMAQKMTWDRYYNRMEEILRAL